METEQEESVRLKNEGNAKMKQGDYNLAVIFYSKAIVSFNHSLKVLKWYKHNQETKYFCRLKFGHEVLYCNFLNFTLGYQ